MSLVLHPHHSIQKPRWQVSGRVERHGRHVVWSMIAQGPSDLEWSTNSRFGEDIRKNWELWNFDVVEAFFQLRSHVDDVRAPYLEVQLSPLRQGLALVILEPRKIFYTPFNLQWAPQSSVSNGHWQTSVSLELPSELGEGELWGGLFACLGQGDRDFYALNPNPEARPDFHRPELFQRL